MANSSTKVQPTLDPLDSVLEHGRIAELAAELSTLTGETPVDAVRTSLEQRLERERNRRDSIEKQTADLLEVAREYAALPVLDSRPADEIIGYDETGMWR